MQQASEVSPQGFLTVQLRRHHLRHGAVRSGVHSNREGDFYSFFDFDGLTLSHARNHLLTSGNCLVTHQLVP